MNIEEVKERLEKKLPRSLYHYLGVCQGKDEILLLVYEKENMSFFEKMFEDAENVKVEFTGIPQAA